MRRWVVRIGVAVVVLTVFAGQWAMRAIERFDVYECEAPAPPGYEVGASRLGDSGCTPPERCWTFDVGPFGEDRVPCPHY